MSSLKLILASLIHSWRVNLAVMLGVAAGAAVLSGAFFVGDSVKGSLRDLAIERLGQIDYAMVAPHFFRAELAEEIKATPGFADHFADAQPAIVLPAVLAKPNAGAIEIDLYAVEDEFWSLSPGGAGKQLPPRGVILNSQTAKELGVAKDDAVLLKIVKQSRVSADSNFGEKSADITTVRLTVSEVIPTEGLGRFGLRPNQQLPKNAYVSTSVVQARSMLDQPGKVNAVLISGQGGSRDAAPAEATSTAAGEFLKSIRPKLADYGLRLAESKRGYLQLNSDAMTLRDAVVEAAQKSFAGLTTQPALTYLANKMEPPAALAGGDDASDEIFIPYSTVTAIDFVADPPLGPWLTTADENAAPLGENEIALNEWAFDDLNRQLAAGNRPEIQIGDSIKLTYFAPEYEAGKAVEHTAEFLLRSVLKLDEPIDDAQPTPVVPASASQDDELTPEVPGLTDKESIEDWTPPFEYDQNLVRDEDDDYWEDYHATPKAFVSLATGQRLWGSRFGNLTAIRLAPPEAEAADQTLDQLAKRLEQNLDAEAAGLVFQPVRRNALAAASGTTPFAGLFFGLSMVLIGAAILLVLLLFRLGVETRANQVGLLLATGMSPNKVRRVLCGEGLLVALIGSAVGTGIGVAYAGVMIHGLRTWWVGAVKTPFLELHVSPLSLVYGFVSGVAAAMFAIWLATRKMKQLSVRQLLAGTGTLESTVEGARSKWSPIFAGVMLVLAIVLAVLASQLVAEAQSGAFMGSGFCVLAAAIALLRARLRAGATGSFATAGAAALPLLALRNAARNPGRSTLTISLVAAALFLITSVSAFWQDLSQEAAEINGGIDLVAQTAVPLNYAFDQEFVFQDQYGFSDDDAAVVADATIISMNMLPGEDASCNNLYQTVRPRVLAVPDELARRKNFLWAGSAAETPEEGENPWLLLSKRFPDAADGTPVAPVILDANTATYSLKLAVGDTLPLTDDYNHTVNLRVVALLKNSIFQGDLLMGKDHFKEQFSYVAGSRFFLVDNNSGAATTEQIAETLSSGLDEYGLVTQTSSARLAGFLAVQNTYISTFLTLGGLGLLLGTFGVATVQIRNVFERRGELALLRATGFRRGRLMRLVLTENVLLLVAGLSVGAVCGLVAIFPQIFLGSAAIPWTQLGVTFAAVLFVGLVAAMFATFSTLRAPLLPALRGE